MAPEVRIETERLVLRVPRLEDAAGAAAYLTDPAVMRFLGGETVPREAAADVVRKWLERWEHNGVGHFAILLRSNGRFLGRTGINVWDARTWTHTTFDEAEADARPELGWALARAHWGNGYATEAAHAVRDWAYRDRQMSGVISLIAPENLASRRVAERLGAAPTERVRLPDSGPADVWVHPT